LWLYGRLNVQNISSSNPFTQKGVRTMKRKSILILAMLMTAGMMTVTGCESTAVEDFKSDLSEETIAKKEVPDEFQSVKEIVEDAKEGTSEKKNTDKKDKKESDKKDDKTDEKKTSDSKTEKKDSKQSTSSDSKKESGTKAGSSKSENKSSGNSSSKPSGNTGNTGNSGSSKPAHTHTWVQDYTTVHHDAQYAPKQVLVSAAWDETVKVQDEIWEDQVVSTNFQCQCGAVFSTDAEWSTHSLDAEFAGMSGHSGCQPIGQTQRVKVQDAVYQTIHHDAVYTTENQLVKAAWDETVPNGQKCSGCGAKK